MRYYEVGRIIKYGNTIGNTQQKFNGILSPELQTASLGEDVRNVFNMKLYIYNVTREKRICTYAHTNTTC